MLAEGLDRETIATAVGVSPGQVSAVAAHVKMGTYALPDVTLESRARAQRLLGRTSQTKEDSCGLNPFRPILLGSDTEKHAQVFWNPDPAIGTANPHVLILGESGFGKTYAICCLLAELAQRGISSIVFDYGQGFTHASAPPKFWNWVKPIEIQAARDGIDINPLTILSFDRLGPLNVAQRIADTFSRVYPKIGVQQHAVLRQAVLDVMADHGIIADDPATWGNQLPVFESIHHKLVFYASSPLNAHSGVAASVASHISTMFVFNTFRPSGLKLTWDRVIKSAAKVIVIQLAGLEYSLERAVTDFLLWNFIGFTESRGPSSLECFVVLDEAHKLTFDRGAPVERLLREGRKFGLGIILASQQAEDFSHVAFSNTATKIVFQVADDNSIVSRQLYRKIRNRHTFNEIHEVITKLPRGHAYAVTDNNGYVLQVTNLEERFAKSSRRTPPQ
jgi:DNA phosphorothioation-dependent restriction protein DptH